MASMLELDDEEQNNISNGSDVRTDDYHGKAGRKFHPGGNGAEDWNASIRDEEDQKNAEADARRNALLKKVQADQQASLGEYDSVMQAVRQQKAQQQIAKQNDTAVLMRLAAENGGSIPPEAAALFNRKFGYDGQTTGLMQGSGFMKDGSFNMRMAMGQDQNGNPVVQDVRATLPQQFVMMNQNRAVFDDDARSALAQKLRSLGYSNRELDRWAIMGGGPNVNERETASIGVSGNVARRLFGHGGDNRSRVTVFGTGGAGTGYTMRDYNGHTGEDTGFVDDPIRRMRTEYLANGRWKVVSSGPQRIRDAYIDENGKRHEAEYADVKVYENEQTGERRTIRDGQGLPQTQDIVEIERAKNNGRRIVRSAEDQIAVENARHKNKMEVTELQEEGKNKRTKEKRDFDRDKLKATIKKWDDDLKVREKNAKTAEDKLALEKERAKYNDYSKRMGVLSNALNSPYLSKDIKNLIRQKIADAVKDDGTPNYKALVESDDQTTIKSRYNSGDETVAGSEPPDGKYTTVLDGKSYHWGKSKNGGWKYFPDKKKQ